MHSHGQLYVGRISFEVVEVGGSIGALLLGFYDSVRIIKHFQMLIDHLSKSVDTINVLLVRLLFISCSSYTWFLHLQLEF